MISIKFTDQTIIKEVYIYDTHGRMVLYNNNINKSNYDISVNNLKSGLYYSKIKSESGAEFSKKFLKE